MSYRSEVCTLESDSTGAVLDVYLELDNNVDPFVVGVDDVYADLTIEQAKQLRDYLIKMLRGK